jgi:hypothetical protein
MATISAQARLCHESYAKCLSLATKLSDENVSNTIQDEHTSDTRSRESTTQDTSFREGPPLPNILKNEAGRFNIWTSNIGVFAELKLSMDYRLRDAPDIRTLVVELLDSLLENLSHLERLLGDKTKVGEGNTLDIAAESSGGAQGIRSKNLTAAVTSVSSDVGRLHRLSNAIHRAGADTRNIRASKFVLRDEEGNDIGAAWRKHFALSLCERQFPAASQILLERIATTMLSRRKRLSYRQSRQEKLSIDTQRPEKLPTRNAQKIKIATSQQPVPAAKAQSQIEKSVTSRSVQTTDTAATPLPAQPIRVSSVISRLSSAQSIRLDDEAKIRFPPPPVAKDSQDVVCPYCSLVLPAQRLRDVKWWR